MFLSMGIIVYAQEIIETDVVERDVIRLAIKEQQDTLYAKTGEYGQIRRDASFDGGLGTELLIMSDVIALADEDYEVHVYEATCGKGYTVLNYYDVEYWVEASSTKLLEKRTYEDTYNITYGCLRDFRPANW